MLILNLSKMFVLRAIDKPFQYLMSKGMSYNKAYRFSRKRVRRFDVKVIEELCLALNCTPNDLFDFVPTKEQKSNPNLELNKIANSNETRFNFKQMLLNAPVDELKELHKQIESINAAKS